MNARRTMPRKRGASVVKPRRFSWPAWLWHWHHLISAFMLFFAVGMAIASLELTPSRIPLRASSAEDIMGWVWADPIGWISVNDLNAGSCGSAPCGTYGVNLDPTTNQINGFAWNDGAGWICFGSSCAASASCNGTPPAGPLTAYLDAGTGTVQAHGWAKVCSEGDDGWISLNCAEPGACAAVSPFYKVVFNHSTGYFKDPAIPGTSFAWNGTIGGTGFGYLDFSSLAIRPEGSLSTPTNHDPTCSDGIDNDLNGLKDCQDPGCSVDPVCVTTSTPPAPPPTPPAGSEAACGPTDNLGRPANPNNCCSDGFDNDSNGQTDCADTSCQLYAPICTPAWLQAKFGNVYAQQGISGQTGASGQPVSNATYCLTSQGTITGFSSSSTCIEASSGQSISLPSTGTGYKGTLGSLDVSGILSGRYGTVVNYLGSLPPVLNGQVYHAVGDVTLGASTFQNGTGATQRGNGLLIVEGNLTITGNLGYGTNQLTQYLKNLASLGIIVKKNPSTGTGGSIFIQPSVTNLVGAYFAEDTIHTGTTGILDQPLQVLGLMAAYKLDLQRNYHDPTKAAETVIFDGRAVANPPPGMQDLSKSLPTSKDAF